jgi:hypothetical protein
MSSTRSPGPTGKRSKSTVSTGPLLRDARQDAAVPGDGRGGDRAPGEALDDAGAAGSAEAGGELGIVEEPSDGSGQRLRVARRDVQGGHAVGADDLGQRAGRRRDERRPARHRLDRRQAEPLVQAGDDGHLRRAEQVDERRLADAVDEADLVGEAEPLDRRGRGAARPRAPDDDQLDVALGPELRDGLEQRHQALEGHVRAGHGDDPARARAAPWAGGRRRSRRPTGTTVSRAGRTRKSRTMSS